MEQRIEIGGHGGQGVVLMSYLLAHLGMRMGLNVTWFPSYGAEMRGGAASCSVRFSDETIESPLIDVATHIIALNNPSFVKLFPKLISGGVILYNSSLITSRVEEIRGDVQAVGVPATEMAQELGQVKIANMVLLGAFLGLTGLASDEQAQDALTERVPPKHAGLIPLNLKSISAGRAYALKQISK